MLSSSVFSKSLNEWFIVVVLSCSTTYHNLQLCRHVLVSPLIAKEVGPLSCARRCFNGIVFIMEVINQVVQNTSKACDVLTH